MMGAMGRVRETWPAWLVAMALVLGACSTPAAGTASASAAVSEAASPSPTTSPTPEILADSFTLADGRSLYLVCRGEGSPTVILEAGDESGMEEWSSVEPQISAQTRTCAYDRGGIGRSDPVSGCRQLPDLTDDLTQLLAAAEVPGPYVLVAGSGGGYIAASFAAQHREDIAGMVFVDVPRAYFDAPPEVVEATSCDNPTNIEHRDYLQVEADAWNSRTEIGDIPITIMSVQYPEDEPDPLAAANVENQRGWLVMSPRATQVVVHTGHDIANEDPAAVIEEITKVIEAAR